MSTTPYELTRCPVCDSLEAVEVADHDAIRSEVELLWAFHERRLREGIPPTYLTDRLAFSQYPPLRVARCGICSHVYRNPWERRDALKSAYASPLPEPSVLRRLLDTQRRTSQAQVRRLTDVTFRPGRGLEVGSYFGGFLEAARDAGWIFEGVDLSAPAVDFVTDRGFRVTRGELADVPADAPFDTIAIWNTFEQLYDVRSALVAARQRLRGGGILVVRIPNGAFYAHWRSRLRGPFRGLALRLLAHNNLLGFPYRQAFTRQSLEHLLRAIDFAVVRVYGDPLAPVADQWTTRYGALEERIVKRVQRLVHRGWRAPWVEVYAVAKGVPGEPPQETGTE
jgi:SAM-dependent methyltransferase